MTDGKFVHLHCHSHYSLFQGTAKIDKLVNRTVELGMNALALTDHGNLFGAIEFYRSCKAAGINPIIGYEAVIAPRGRFQRDKRSKVDWRYRLTLLAQNRKGFENLLKLSTKAYLEGFCRGTQIDRELLEACSEGLICLSGSAPSELWHSLTGRDPDQPHSFNDARLVASWYRRVFGDRYFIEIQDIGDPVSKLNARRALAVAHELGIPPVATCDCRSVDLGDASSLETLLCIGRRRLQSDSPRTRRMYATDFYLKSPQDMYYAFHGMDRSVVADAVARSQTIADTVSIELELGKRHFPSFEVPSGRTASEELRELCLEGLRQRYAAVPKRWSDGKSPAEGGSGELASDVLARLEYELDAITTRGVAEYFLMVASVVRIARENQILTSTRGTSPGSLVVYSLWISHMCPLEYGLLFERFFDIHGDAAPDVCIDVCEERRNDLIDCLKNKYGQAHVAKIGRRDTRSARAAIREVGHALAMESSLIDSIVDLVPSSLGITLERAAEPGTSLAEVCGHIADVAQVVFRAKDLEGLACAVLADLDTIVITDRPLVEFVPLCCDADTAEIFTQWPSDDITHVGLMKMTFFRNRSLTIVSKALDLIHARTGVRPDPLAFPLDDAATFAAICQGDIAGVFALESFRMQELVSRMKPARFAEIGHAIALCRPGPIDAGLLEDYLTAKQRREMHRHAHPAMVEILADTYGFLVYEEQTMRILERFAGIDLASGHACMKVYGKEWTHTRTEVCQELKAFCEQFDAGALGKGLSESQASQVLFHVQAYGRCAFNKSHALAYAWLSYQMAYMKTHWRDEFNEACQRLDIFDEEGPDGPLPIVGKSSPTH